MYFTMHCLRCPGACPQSSFRFRSYQFPVGSWREWKYILLLPRTDFLYFKFRIVFCLSRSLPSRWTRTGRRTRRRELQPTLQMRLQLNLQHQIQSREPQRVLLTSSPGCARARAKTTRWPRKRRRLNLKILAWSVLLLMMISSIISSSCSVTQSCDVAVATLSTV